VSVVTLANAGLGAKAVLAVMLLVAGGAKLADLASFAASVRLFAPRRMAASASSGPLLRRVALAVALGELALGTASLTSPGLGWLNPVILAVGCAFVAVSGVGYAVHRGRSCRCFGALSQRRFDRAGIARAAVVAALAGVAMAPVPPSSIRLGLADRGLLLSASCLLIFVAFIAAGALAESRAAHDGAAHDGAALSGMVS
jgi:hypothetical protein